VNTKHSYVRYRDAYSLNTVNSDLPLLAYLKNPSFDFFTIKMTMSYVYKIVKFFPDKYGVKEFIVANYM
jgi:hypothetical protein